ncbi:hypothetical protein DFH06DRAFT_1328219 [Mycena polygramma]|nr:hypothetical protein DFH06DRAFT_1328219 [Mycena polygramma]
MEKKASGFPWDTLFYMGPLAHSVSHVKLDLFELWDTLPSPPTSNRPPACEGVRLVAASTCLRAHGAAVARRRRRHAHRLALRTRREYKFVHLAQRSLLTPYTVAKPALAGVRGSRQNELRLASYEVKSHNAHRDDAALPSPGAL